MPIVDPERKQVAKKDSRREEGLNKQGKWGFRLREREKEREKCLTLGPKTSCPINSNVA